MATFSLFECGPSGGATGDLFRDLPAAGVTVTKIRVTSGHNTSVGGHPKLLNSIQLIYGHGHTDLHGQDHGTPQNIDLAGQEYIVEVSGKYGDFIDQFNIRTSGDRDFGPFGGDGGRIEFRYHVPDGMAIIGFFGSSGACVDALGILYRPISG
jgi:Jacalin-like lectin domain